MEIYNPRGDVLPKTPVIGGKDKWMLKIAQNKIIHHSYLKKSFPVDFSKLFYYNAEENIVEKVVNPTVVVSVSYERFEEETLTYTVKTPNGDRCLTSMASEYDKAISIHVEKAQGRFSRYKMREWDLPKRIRGKHPSIFVLSKQGVVGEVFLKRVDVHFKKGATPIVMLTGADGNEYEGDEGYGSREEAIEASVSAIKANMGK